MEYKLLSRYPRLREYKVIWNYIIIVKTVAMISMILYHRDFTVSFSARIFITCTPSLLYLFIYLFPLWGREFVDLFCLFWPIYFFFLGHLLFISYIPSFTGFFFFFFFFFFLTIKSWLSPELNPGPFVLHWQRRAAFNLLNHSSLQYRHFVK